MQLKKKTQRRAITSRYLANIYKSIYISTSFMRFRGTTNARAQGRRQTVHVQRLRQYENRRLSCISPQFMSTVRFLKGTAVQERASTFYGCVPPKTILGDCSCMLAQEGVINNAVRYFRGGTCMPVCQK